MTRPALLLLLAAVPACAQAPARHAAWAQAAGPSTLQVRVQSQVRGVIAAEERGDRRRGRPVAVFELVNESAAAQRLTLAWEWRDAAGMRLAGEDARLDQKLVLRPGEARTFTRQTGDPAAVAFVARIRST